MTSFPNRRPWPWRQLQKCFRRHQEMERMEQQEAKRMRPKTHILAATIDYDGTIGI